MESNGIEWNRMELDDIPLYREERREERRAEPTYEVI